LNGAPSSDFDNLLVVGLATKKRGEKAKAKGTVAKPSKMYRTALMPICVT